ncbi:hypothetical protein KM043_009499 [Ampulex compressa]|nr:hypothetical protein KM043_009499 [Ampulex compressa]
MLGARSVVTLKVAKGSIQYGPRVYLAEKGLRSKEAMAGLKSPSSRITIKILAPHAIRLYLHGNMARAPDQELKKAFSELHEKMVDTTQKLKLADVQIEKLRRTKQRAELTVKEISSLSENTRTYESVGRMFLLDDINNIKVGLEKRMKTADEKVKTLENNKVYLQQSLKESENNIREMIQQRQNKDASG